MHEVNDDTDGLVNDLKSKQVKVLLTMAQIEQEMGTRKPGCCHKINHIMISPNGKRAMFLYRQILPEKKIDWLVVIDLTSNAYQSVNQGEMVSHCFWKDNETIVGWLEYRQVSGLYSIDISTGVHTQLNHSGLTNNGDGHPHLNRTQCRTPQAGDAPSIVW